MKNMIVTKLHTQRKQLEERWFEEIEMVRSEIYMDAVSTHLFDSINRDFIHLIIESANWEQEEAQEKVSKFTARFIDSGIRLEYFIQGLQAFRRVTFEIVMNEQEDTKEVMNIFNEIDGWIDSLINKLVRDYSGSWENRFELQKLSLLELSAPLIPIFENISVMPLIGTIDTARAKLIMENLLQGVIKHRSQVVLIDITGVPVVDTMVAHHIIQAVEAVRLVGAKCILVGIRPEIAQTIVNLGIDLRDLPTKSTLKKGVQTALLLTEKKVVDA